MTDEQIIIDGVDVSFCPNHYNGWSSLHRDTRAMCECGYSRECSPRKFECSHYVKCLEKKLQAKEQECEELKERLIKCDDNIIVECEYSKNDLCSFIHRKKEVINGLQQQLDQLKAENEELKNILWNVDFNRQSKGRKLIRIEELLKKCATGYTDEFIQEMFSILYELEPICRYNKLEKYSKIITEIKEIAENLITITDEYDNCYHKDECDKCLLGIDGNCQYIKVEQILQKISEVEND